mmetsp:Transcript_9465/g.25713  ORF Transcript_9465/g.25713 Transcript_9465/m.25713 type:complete len:283 (+) Transcript_9465:565-1413(+)
MPTAALACADAALPTCTSRPSKVATRSCIFLIASRPESAVKTAISSLSAWKFLAKLSKDLAIAFCWALVPRSSCTSVSYTLDPFFDWGGICASGSPDDDDEDNDDDDEDDDDVGPDGFGAGGDPTSRLVALLVGGAPGGSGVAPLSTADDLDTASTFVLHTSPPPSCSSNTAAPCAPQVRGSALAPAESRASGGLSLPCKLELKAAVSSVSTRTTDVSSTDDRAPPSPSWPAVVFESAESIPRPSCVPITSPVPRMPPAPSPLPFPTPRSPPSSFLLPTSST